MATPDKILLVESQPRIVEMLVEGFVRRFDAHITCVPTAEDALDVAIVEPHTVTVADTALAGMDTITLAQRLGELDDRPVILMGSDPTTADVIEAMRYGVVDFFRKPFELDALLDSVERAFTAFGRRDRIVRRQHRLRRLCRRVVRERRELNKRVELVCKDLVAAHKRLVVRVLSHETSPPSAGGTQPAYLHPDNAT